MNTATDSATADRDDPDSSAGESDQPPEPARPRPGRRSEATADVSIDVRPEVRWTIDRRWLRARLLDATAQVARSIGRVSVSVLDDAAMRAMHRRYLGSDETTDVLSFPVGEGDSVDVDVAVCADEAQRQAEARGHDVTRELLLYALHGLLHCAGFDDHDEAGYDAMHAEEDRILDAIGVGTTFGRTPAGPRRPDA